MRLQTNTQNLQYLLYFHGYNCYAKASQCYLCTYIDSLVIYSFPFTYHTGMSNVNIKFSISNYIRRFESLFSGECHSLRIWASQLHLRVACTGRTKRRSLGIFRKSNALSEIGNHWIEKYCNLVFFKADSHIAFRAHAPPMPFPCHAVPLRV